MEKYLKIIYNILRSFSVSIFSFILSILGIQLFGKESWGEFIYINTWLILAVFIINFGNKEYLVRKFSKNPSRISYFFNRNLIARSILIITIIPFYFLFNFKIAFWSSVLVLLMFIYQSFESLIIYFQRFKLQLLTEFIGFTLIIFYIINNKQLKIDEFLSLICLSIFIKLLIVFINFKKEIKFEPINFSVNELKNLIPFFLIVLSGFLVSKIDLLLINIYLDKKSIAEYQIGITSFLLLQSLAYLIILPFNKHFYRLKSETINRIKYKLAMISIPILLLGTLLIWFVFEKIIHLNLSTYFYLIGMFSSFPIYLYVIDIQLKFKNIHENYVVLVSFIGALVNLLITLLLIRKLGVIGGLIGSMTAQFIILLCYKSNTINKLINIKLLDN